MNLQAPLMSGEAADSSLSLHHLLDPAVRADPGVYPPQAVRARLTPEPARPPEYQRLLTRMWTRFKTGR